MKIKCLTLTHFRRFTNFEMDFHPQLTVLVARNGAGKSSILDAIATALGVFLTRLPKVVGLNPKETDFQVYANGQKAKVVTGMAEVSQQIDKIFKSSMSKPKGGRGYGIVGGISGVGSIFGGVRSWLEDVFTQEDKQEDFKHLDKAINELIEVMREQGLDELIEGFKE